MTSELIQIQIYYCSLFKEHQTQIGGPVNANNKLFTISNIKET